ncbi:hypothetical protein SARC_14999, partial [Sphaeroforma arctica JP610]
MRSCAVSHILAPPIAHSEQLKIELSKRRGARPSAKHTDGDAGVADRHSKMTVSSARPNGE